MKGSGGGAELFGEPRGDCGIIPAHSESVYLGHIGA